MKVSIPTPCNENWKEMTPTQRGAFCKKCAIDVVDFSNKSAEEIRSTLKENIGKHLCGRFKKSQLEDLSQAYHLWENQSKRTFQSKFLWACMLAFGLTLFASCDTSNAQTSPVQPEKFTPELYSDTTKKDTTDNLPILMGDTIVTPLQGTQNKDCEQIHNDFELGEPTVDYDPPLKLSEVMVELTPIDTPEVLPVQPVMPDRNHELIMGKMIAPPQFNDFLIDTVRRENLPEVIESEELIAMVYPNPSKGNSQLIITPKKKDYYSISLYNLAGQELSSIHEGNLLNKENVLELDLSAYPNGIYLIKITSNYRARALKINKIG